MPIYEYVCEACGYEFDELQSMGEPALTICPKCGKKSLKKKMSVSGFALKGTGWYVTDFKNSSKSSSKKSKAQSSSKKSKAQGAIKGNG